MNSPDVSEEGNKNPLNKVQVVEQESSTLLRLLPSLKCIEKRASLGVSAEESMEDSVHETSTEKRKSWNGNEQCSCDDDRDLNDLRDLLISLKKRDILPDSVAFAKLFANLDESMPVLSERTPPEGREDPPVHNSSASLFPSSSLPQLPPVTPPCPLSPSVSGEFSCSSSGLLFESTNPCVDRLHLKQLPYRDISHIFQFISVYNEDEDQSSNCSSSSKLFSDWRNSSIDVRRPKIETQHLVKWRNLSGVERRKLLRQKDSPAWPKLYVKQMVGTICDVEQLEIVTTVQQDPVRDDSQATRRAHEIAATLFGHSNETVHRVFDSRIGHTRGQRRCVQVVLSSHALYVIPNTARVTKALHSVLYNDIHTIVVGMYEQWVAIVDRLTARKGNNSPRKEVAGIQIEFGDCDLTRNFLSNLEVSIRKDVRRRLGGKGGQQWTPTNGVYPVLPPWLRREVATRDKCLPAVFTTASWELEGLQTWLKCLCKLPNKPHIHGSWLVDWEDGSSFGNPVSPLLAPLGHSVDGPLMFKSAGILSWQPAYFILKGGVLYRFRESSDRLPESIIDCKNWVLCRRMIRSGRPHSFELSLLDGNSLQLAACNEERTSIWLQAFCTIIAGKRDNTVDRQQISCRLIVTDTTIYLVQQMDLLWTPLCVPSGEQRLGSEAKTDHLRSPDGNSCKSVLSGSNQDVMEISGNVVPPIMNFIKSSSKIIPGSPSKQRHLPPSSLRRGGSEAVLSSPIRMGAVEGMRLRGDGGEMPASDAVSPLISTEKVRDVSCGVRILGSASIEQLTAFYSLMKESATACLLEFECAEASEIIGDWTLYFRRGSQVKEFMRTLQQIWNKLGMGAIPVQMMQDGNMHQFLLDGSHISLNHWTQNCAMSK